MGDITTPASSASNKNGTSGMSAGLIVLIVLLVLLCCVSLALGAFLIMRKMSAEKRDRMPMKDLRQCDLETGNATVVREPSHTLLDGDARETKKVEETSQLRISGK